MLMDDKAADQIPDIADIISARNRIQGEIRTTPILSDPQLNTRLGCELWLKCENLQRTGAFKFRGASSAMAIVWQYFRILIEPSSSTVIVAILASPEDFSGKRVGAIISGGNVDLENLPFKP